MKLKFQIGERVIFCDDIWQDDKPTGTIAGTAVLARPDDSVTAGVDLVYCVRLDDKYQGRLISAGQHISTILAQEDVLEPFYLEA